ncbi:MAG: hypothetical protein PHD91_06115, partial [bacterium]|nr:hypothetical protein [bacterium]
CNQPIAAQMALRAHFKRGTQFDQYLSPEGCDVIRQAEKQLANTMKRTAFIEHDDGFSSQIIRERTYSLQKNG